MVEFSVTDSILGFGIHVLFNNADSPYTQYNYLEAMCMVESLQMCMWLTVNMGWYTSIIPPCWTTSNIKNYLVFVIFISVCMEKVIKTNLKYLEKLYFTKQGIFFCLLFNTFITQSSLNVLTNCKKSIRQGIPLLLKDKASIYVFNLKEGGRMRSILEPKPKLRFNHSILKIRLVLISFPSS